MSDRESRPFDVEAAITQVVAESLSGAWASSSDPDGVWRLRGSQATQERTPSDLDRARLDTRKLLEGSPWDDGNEFAIGAAENRVDYVIGEAGLKYEAVAAPGVSPDPSLLAEAQYFIDRFAELNDLAEIERETVWRLDRDGDAFVRLFEGDGIPEVEFVAPERVKPPADSKARLARAGEILKGYDDCRDDWGVIHDRRNRKRVRGYWVEEDDGEPVVVPASEICHCKLNTTSEWPRGWPTFEPVRRSLIRAEELLVAMTATGKARAKIALITTIPGWTREKADALVARLTSKYQDQPSGEAPKEESVEELPYGAHVRVREGTTVSFPPPGLGAGELVEAIQSNLRTAGARLRMPEWMFSGMADQKYSNAFVVEAPSLKMFKGLQGRVTQFLGSGRMAGRASVVWKALRMAALRGWLNPAVLRAVAVKVTAPSLESRDKQAEASANSTYINLNVKSRETVQEEIGLDPQSENPRIEAESKKFGLAGKRSELLGGGQPPDDLARAGEIPPPTGPAAEALVRAIGEWFAETEGGAGSAGATFPGGHFGVAEDGAKWVSEELIRYVGEAAKKGKVLKEIEVTMRSGKTYKRKVWVNSEDAKALDAKAKQGDKKGSAPSVPAAAPAPPANHFERVVDAFRAPSATDAGSLRASLAALSDSDLNAFVRQTGTRTRLPRAAAIEQVVGHIEDRSTPTSKPPVKPPVKREVNLGVPPAPRSKAALALNPAVPAADVEKVSSEVFGGDGPAASRTLVESVGMPDAATVRVTQAGAFDKKFSDDSPKKGARGVRVEVEHPDLGRVSRFVGIDGKGKRFVRNEILEVNKDKQGGGLGADIFRKQVEASSAEGVDYIETHAVGSFGSSYNGYYTWAQFGYNAPVRAGKKWAPVKTAFPAASSIQDVMDAPRANIPPEEVKRISDKLNAFDAKRGKPPKDRQFITGEEWWKVNGFELRGMKFDLKPGSRSMKRFAAYLKKKQAAAQTQTVATPT
jgi:hypothetical protein